MPFSHQTEREDIRQYVANLQLHMTLQARNLVPSLITRDDNRSLFLYDTQAQVEKRVSRQKF